VPEQNNIGDANIAMYMPCCMQWLWWVPSSETWWHAVCWKPTDVSEERVASETLVDFQQTTRYYTPKDRTPHATLFPYIVKQVVSLFKLSTCMALSHMVQKTLHVKICPFYSNKPWTLPEWSRIFFEFSEIECCKHKII
jgi:hypothetical protein